MKGHVRRLCFWLGLVFGVAGIGYAAYIPVKAWLAQVLLEVAWTQRAETGLAVRPWPWADMAPVARLRQPRLGIDQIVLNGASGRVLAFGPGHVTGSTPPGGAGNTVISAHRDTHFRWLRYLERGDELRLDTSDGMTRRYRVADLSVHDESEAYLLDPGQGDQLRLITCHPFDGVAPGTRMRFVVTADPLSPGWVRHREAGRS